MGVEQGEELQRLKTNILQEWHGLPRGQQVALLTEMVRGIRESTGGQSVPRELELGLAGELTTPADQPIPTNWVHKDDLMYSRPDLSERIQALDEQEVKYIADKIGDALQETYWVAMGIILDAYLDSENTPKDDDEQP